MGEDIDVYKKCNLKFLICFLLLGSSVAHSETETSHYYFGAGIPFYNTNELLTESMISINKLAIKGLRSFDEKEGSDHWTSSVGYRIARAVGVDLPISLYTAEISHEYFGHGFPSLNYGGKIDEVHIDFPPLPYNLNYSSYTKTSGANVPADIYEEWSNHQRANGLQVESSISHQVQNKFWETKSVDYDLSILLLKTAYAPMWYVTFYDTAASDIGNVNASNDIEALAARYTNLSGKQYTSDQIRDRSLLYNSLNPMVLWSWYSVFKYMATGEAQTELPYISISGFKWLPGLAYNLTGYGEEYALVNYFQTPEGRNGSFEIGNGTVNNKFRYSLAVNNILGGINSRYELGAELHYWKQKLEGKAAFLDLNYYFSDSKSSGIHLKLGYKTFGYLRGYGLKASAIANIGYVFLL